MSAGRALIVLAGCTLFLAACTPAQRPSGDRRSGAAAGQESTMTAPSSIVEVQERNTPSLMAIPGVVGTAIGEQRGRPCIIVFVKVKDDSLEARIPAVLEGYPVRLEEVGEIRPITP